MVTNYRMNEAGLYVPFGVGVAFTTKVPEVCRECNGGWMAKIEDAVAPILKPVIFDGETSRIDSDSARWLAAWLYLRAMVLQYVNMRHELRPDYCQAIYESKTHAPETSKVWIGLVDLEHIDHSHHGSSILNVPPGIPAGPHREPHMASLTVGYLVGRVFMYPESLKGNPELLGINNGVFDNFLSPIWPDDHVTEWPTKRLNLGGYLTLAKALPLYPLAGSHS